MAICLNENDKPCLVTQACNGDDAAITHLASRPEFRELRILELYWNRVGLAGVQALVHSPYLHNLEHGGIVFLYHPCAEDAVVDALRELARARPEDDTGLFR